MKRFFLFLALLILTVALASCMALTPADPGNDPETPPSGDVPGGDPSGDPSGKTDEPDPPKVYLSETGADVKIYSPEDYTLWSTKAIVVSLDTPESVVEMGADDVIYPASMTKVMTLLVACEKLDTDDLDRTVTMDSEIIREMRRQNASGWGLAEGEQLTVRDLLYAIGLESDCAASEQLATVVAGSTDNFVRMMNQKAAELGLTKTKFVNCTGLHDEGHVTTCREMAAIMAAAGDNETVRAILSTTSYKTTTDLHGRATFYSTFYNDVVESLRKRSIRTSPKNGSFVCAKTGMTDEAGSCLVTLFVSDAGHEYVVVTADAGSSSEYVADHILLCEKHAK